ncbi:hypothetical protein EYZ11_002004 [Aspergillus tanneri]|uniref:Uncharacterized protein n=1 Tax=Aspergillus tanneri TaxID=1220188 RepID=A0A4S3JS03_9EURO|nr:hypothetical protein EYZ11_002004 [Aspergillus tanneri]
MTVAGVVGESVTGRIQCIVRRENSNLLGKRRRSGREIGGATAPLVLEWVNIDQLVYHEKSGKLKAIIEERY